MESASIPQGSLRFSPGDSWLTQLGNPEHDGKPTNCSLQISASGVDTLLKLIQESMRVLEQRANENLHSIAQQLAGFDGMLSNREASDATTRVIGTRLEADVRTQLRAELVDFEKTLRTNLTRDLARSISKDERERDQPNVSTSPPAVKLKQTTVKVDNHETCQTAKTVAQGEIDIDVSPSPAKKGTKISIAEDHDVDTSQLQLREGQSLGDIFQVDTDVAAPHYHVEDHYKPGIFKTIVMSDCFQYFTLLVIICNVIYLAIESDWNEASNLYEAKWPYFVATQFFCAYFTVEVLLRFAAFRVKRDSFQDGWFRFDFFLVTTMALEVWLLMPLLYVFTSGQKMKVPTQPLRIIRLLKLARMARLMKAIPELVTMINGLFQALRAIFSTMVLVALMVYAWSILIHMFMKDEKEYNLHLKNTYQLHFDGIMDCMWTLLISGTLMLDNTGLMMTELVFNDNWAHWATGVAFISYSFLSALLVLQMLIGVLCDVVGQVAQDRRNADSIGLMKQELLGNLLEADGGDGKISREELLSVFECESSRRLFKKLNINRLFLTSVANLMFRDAGTLVPIRSILELMVMCKGDNPATVQILASALCFLSCEIEHLHDNMHINFKFLSGDDPNTPFVKQKTGFARPSFNEAFSHDVTPL